MVEYILSEEESRELFRDIYRQTKDIFEKYRRWEESSWKKMIGPFETLIL